MEGNAFYEELKLKFIWEMKKLGKSTTNFKLFTDNELVLIRKIGESLPLSWLLAGHNVHPINDPMTFWDIKLVEGECLFVPNC